MAKRVPKTVDELARMRDKAVAFLRHLVGDDERAARFEAMTPEEYGRHKGIEVKGNPARHHQGGALKGERKLMARAGTRTELLAEIRDLKSEIRGLEETNEELSDRLDQILDLAETEEEDSEGEDDGEDDEEEDGR